MTLFPTEQEVQLESTSLAPYNGLPEPTLRPEIRIGSTGGPVQECRDRRIGSLSGISSHNEGHALGLSFHSPDRICLPLFVHGRQLRPSGPASGADRDEDLTWHSRHAPVF